MREKKIGLLALQETHLSDQLTDQTSTLYQRRLSITNSPDLENPSGSAGVAFVINKEVMKTEQIRTHTLIPGRAILISFRWQHNSTLTAINVYAPNDPNKHSQFWSELTDRWANLNLPEPDILLGDFNITEELLDRSPARHDSEIATRALRECRHRLGVRDSWRTRFPTERSFTFTTPNHTMSRLDRIYIKEDLEDNVSDWSCDIPGIPTDHKMVSARLTPTNAPHIGKDRWSWPLGLLHDKQLNKKIHERGQKLCTDLEELRVDDRSSNAQTLWQNFKDDIKIEATKAAKEQIPKITQRIKALKQDLAQTHQNDEIDSSPSIRTSAAFIEREIDHLEKKKFRKAYTRSQALWHLKGEKISKYWSKVNNPKKPRDLIHRLIDPQTQKPITRSDEMARLTRDYHESLQTEDLQPPTDQARKQAIERTLESIPDAQKLRNPDASPLNSEISLEDLLNALNQSKVGTAAGPDGIPYEVWKHLHQQYKSDLGHKRPAFNALNCMLSAMQDVQKHGVDQRTKLTMGWLCPIYKKKEKDQIKNYRPITLLNTDYKLLTKALSTQLTTHIHSLIHPDQHGFIRNRTILDPIRLNQTICAYADYMEENGAIVALDQEKAYDKIDHGYLLEVLKKFNLPHKFISTISSLYNTANTAVLINGVLSPPYKVTRGVRQGDPLSCLLFNLAIEPLACDLRSSRELKGFQIPGIKEKLIVSLYADDTTIYLSESDSYTALQRILTSWCLASGAKFNLEKTEIVPIGTPEHRERIWSTRKINHNDPPLHGCIHIAKDGQAVRCLGAWIGNDTKETDPWEPILDKVRATMQKWNKSHPTLDAKRHIVQMFAGGMTQFLTAAQGMPRQTENALVKIIREFIWDSTAPPMMSLERLYAQVGKGGIGLLNIRARNKAINIIRLKAFVDLSPRRPKWAYLTDAIINTLHPNPTLDQPPFPLTTWAPPSQGPRASALPQCITAIIKTAKESKLTFAPLRLSKQLKLQLPAWFHMGAPPRTYNKLKDKCLQQRHKVTKVKNLRKMIRRLQPGTNHRPTEDCTCTDCNRDREKGCKNPNQCTANANTLLLRLTEKLNPAVPRQKDDLTLTHRRQEKNARAIIQRGDETIFNPSVTIRTSLEDCFRIFPSQGMPPQPALRPIPQENRHPPLTIYTDGSCEDNGSTTARCGAGIWISDSHPLNRSIKVPGPSQSNQVGELAAILVALQISPRTADLTIITDSQYAIKALNHTLQDWEDSGWSNVQNATWLEATAYHLRIRCAPTRFKWVKGHDGTRGNEEADKLAAIGVNKPTPDEIDLSVPDTFCPTGMKLMKTTQARAYAYITNRDTPQLKRRTEILLDQIRTTLEETNKHAPTDRKIWEGCRHRDIRRPIQTFLYKAINNALRIGEFWERIPNLEQRARCASCNAPTESLEHILIDCDHPSTKQIWMLAKRLWPTNHPQWQDPSLGILLGCGSIALEPTETHPDTKAPSRLLRILLSEAAHLTWVLRCERTIQGATHSPAAVETRWRTKINQRITTDRFLATFHEQKSLTRNLVYNTWTPTLHRLCPDLDPDWVSKHEVLVGINPTTPVAQDQW